MSFVICNVDGTIWRQALAFATSFTKPVHILPSVIIERSSDNFINFNDLLTPVYIYIYMIVFG